MIPIRYWERQQLADHSEIIAHLRNYESCIHTGEPVDLTELAHDCGIAAGLIGAIQRDNDDIKHKNSEYLSRAIEGEKRVASLERELADAHKDLRIYNVCGTCKYYNSHKEIRCTKRRRRVDSDMAGCKSWVWRHARVGRKGKA